MEPFMDSKRGFGSLRLGGLSQTSKTSKVNKPSADWLGRWTDPIWRKGENDCRLSWSCFAQVHFVCERGHFFEEDHAQEEITYECQDGTVPGTRKGFFNNPEEEAFWPKCLQGWSIS